MASKGCAPQGPAAASSHSLSERLVSARATAASATHTHDPPTRVNLPCNHHAFRIFCHSLISSHMSKRRVVVFSAYLPWKIFSCRTPAPCSFEPGVLHARLGRVTPAPPANSASDEQALPQLLRPLTAYEAAGAEGTITVHVQLSALTPPPLLVLGHEG